MSSWVYCYRLISIAICCTNICCSVPCHNYDVTSPSLSSLPPRHLCLATPGQRIGMQLFIQPSYTTSGCARINELSQFLIWTSCFSWNAPSENGICECTWSSGEKGYRKGARLESNCLVAVNFKLHLQIWVNFWFARTWNWVLAGSLSLWFSSPNSDPSS